MPLYTICELPASPPLAGQAQAQSLESSLPRKTVRLRAPEPTAKNQRDKPRKSPAGQEGAGGEAVVCYCEPPATPSLESSDGLQVSFEVVFLSQLISTLRCQRIHVDLPPRTKACMPSPQTAQQRFGIGIVHCPESTGLAIVCTHRFLLIKREARDIWVLNNVFVRPSAARSARGCSPESARRIGVYPIGRSDGDS